MNENSSVRSLGERVAVLEAVNREMRESLDHLHDCMHGVKDEAIKNNRTWDRRWNLLIGGGTALLIVSGFSLKTLMEVLSKVK